MEREPVVNALLRRPALPAPSPKPPKGLYWWPDAEDIGMSKQYDTLYGSPHAPHATPGAAYKRTVPLQNIMSWASNNKALMPEGMSLAINTEKDADQARAQALAAERSAIAKLGFNPSYGASTPSGREALNVRGLFRAAPSNFSWYDEGSPYAGMHESMHRGISMLRQAGKLPPEVADKVNKEEEYIVRALMNRAYGPVEVAQEVQRIGPLKKDSPGYQQIVKGMALEKHPVIDALEAAAADEVVRRRPRGPR